MVRGGREQGGSIRNRGWLGGRGAHEELGEEVGKGGGGRSACDGEGEARDGETMEEGGGGGLPERETMEKSGG